jgi:ferric iron reductase protein FhuF
MPARAAVAEALALSAGGFSPEIRLVDDAPPGWVSLTELASPAARPERHRAIAEAAGPGAPARLPLVWEIEAIAWFVGVAVGAPALRDAPRLDPGPESAWVRVGDAGLTEAIALHGGARQAPSSDSAARASITRLLAPAVEGGSGGRSARVLWWHVGDRIADALLWCGEALGSPPAGLGLAERMLAPGVPFAVPVAADASGHRRVRRTCCLARRLPGEVACEGCPLRDCSVAQPQRHSSQ